MKKMEVIFPDICYNKFNEQDTKIIIASALYDNNILGLGYAAESVGLDKRTLIENMGKFGVSPLKLNNDDAERIIKNAKKRASLRK